MTELRLAPPHSDLSEDPMRFLDRATVQRIDQALCKVGDFGEVVLVVIKGRLRFIQITQSENIQEA